MNTAPSFGSRPVRSIAWVCAAVWSAALLGTGGCSSDESSSLLTGGTAPSGGSNAGPVAGSTAGVFSSGGNTSGTAGSGAKAGSSGVGGAPVGTGGTPGSSGNVSSGGVSSGGVSTGGSGGSTPKPCVDVEPPKTAEWPDATCENWATETDECGKDWFKTYCDVSCKRCTPQGGAGGSGGSGGSSSTGGNTGTGGSTAVDCSTKGLPNVTGGNGFATRYWDCCQPHCAQSDGHRCEQNGTTRTGNNQSACAGGGSYACYDEAPKAVNECLSYGYIAKTNPNCGACYRIQFTGEGQHNAADPGSKLLKGKQMIVKVSNTGGDVANNQFDLMVPGGGVGQFNACSKQWGTNDLGAQYGGFLTNCTGTHAAKKECVRQNCMKIPAGPARDGCIWFVDWFQAADNPKFTSQQTDCPF